MVSEVTTSTMIKMGKQIQTYTYMVSGQGYVKFLFFVLSQYVIYNVKFIIIIYKFIMLYRLWLIFSLQKQYHSIYYMYSIFSITKNPETYYKKLFLFAPLIQSTHTSWNCKSAFLLELPVLYFFTQIDVLYYYHSLFVFFCLHFSP